MNMDVQLNDILLSIKSGIIYIPQTLLIAAVPVVVGFVLGAIVATVRFFKVPVASQFFAFFVSVYSGIPSVVALLVYNLLFMTVFDPVAIRLGLSIRSSQIPLIHIALFTFTLSSAVMQSETIRGALTSINKGQFEAGYSVGLKQIQIMQRVVFPQVVPVLIPPYINHIVGAVKNTSIVMTIGVVDVLNGAQEPAHMSYRYLESYIAAAVIYWILNAAIETGLKRLENVSSAYRKGGTK